MWRVVFTRSFGLTTAVFCLTVFGLLAGRIAPTHAAASGNDLASLSAQIELQTDGSVNIVQNLDYGFQSPLDWQLFTNARNLSITADGNKLNPNQWQTSSGQGYTLLTATAPAESWKISYNTTTTLIRHNNVDQVYLKLFQQTGFSIGSVDAGFTLPADVPNNQLTGNVYSISGSLDANQQVINSRSVEYTASYAGPDSLFTISATWPKGVLNLSTWQELRLSLLNLNSLPWIIIGCLLPLITLTILLIIRRWVSGSETPVTQLSATPPSALSPIMVGVLVNKKIYADEIVAMLVDLCQRGYLVLVKKQDQFYLSQRKLPDEHLQSWEREILDQLFPTLGAKVGSQEAKELGGDNLFSPLVRDAFGRIYQVTTDSQFFVENPHLTRIRYKLAALVFYFLAFFGIIFTMVFNATPFLLIPMVGTLALAYLIIRISPRLIRYTNGGLVARQQWLSFGNSLRLSQPIGLEGAQNHLFEKYLPYAIALHCSEEWAGRFDQSSTVMVRPDWFINYTNTDTKKLSAELIKFAEVIGEQVTKLRGPLVN